MMFSLSFAVVLLLTFGINGQTNDINTFQTNNLEKGYPFGKLRLAEEGKNEELIPTIDFEKHQPIQDQPSSGVQPLPSPCIGTTSVIKLAYPRDKTKYIQCRDEFHYEIFTCPNGGEYNEQTDSCDLILPMVDRCEQEKPCFNDGQCTLLSNSTFKCICRPDWTGDRCETPINSCVKKPCGPNADCRILKTIDYEQDYVCVCHGMKGYGLNCQEVVPNPCLTTSEQFFPYAFSQRAYIQCDGDLVYFQPCGPLLYWHQEEKICDRKRPPKLDLPALLLKYVSNNNDNQQENNEGINLQTTTVQTDQQNSIVQNGRENERVFAFVPARVANRQQFQDNMNNEQDSLSQQVQSQQNVMSKTDQRSNKQTESTLKQFPTMQTGQNQPWQNNPNTQMGGFQSPQSGGFQSPGFQSPQSVGFQQPQSGGFQQPQSAGFQQPQSVGFQQPQSGGFQQPQSVGFQQPQSGGFQQPQSVGFQQPQSGGFQQPQSVGFQQPQSGGFQQPQHIQNFVPQSPQSAGFQSPQSVGFQHPQSGGFQQPQSPGFQSSQSSGFQSPQSPGFQSPQTPGFHSPQLGGVQSPQSVGFQPPQSVGFQHPQSGGFQQPQSPGFQSPQTPGFQSPQSVGSQQPQAAGFDTQNTQQFAPQSPGFQSPQSSGFQSPQSVGFQHPQSGGFQQPQSPGFQSPQTPGFQSPQSVGSQQPQSAGFDTQNTQQFAPQSPGFQHPQSGGFQQPQSAGFQQPQSGGFQQPQAAGFDTQNTQQFAPQSPGFQHPQSGGFQHPQSGGFQQPQSAGFDTQNPQQFAPQSPGFQHPQSGGFQQPQSGGFQQPQSPGFQSPQPGDFNTQNNQNFFPQSQPWLGSKTNQNKPTLLETTTITPQNVTRSQGVQNSNTLAQDQSWKNKPKFPITGQQSPQSIGFNVQNTPNFVLKGQSWQSSQTNQNQPQFSSQNQQTLFATTTTTPIPQNINRFQSFQNPNTQEQDQSWQNIQQIPQIQNQASKLQSNQIFAFQPRQWPETSKQTQQSLIANPSSEIQNTQYGFNQQFQPQGSQLTDSNNLKFQTNQNLAARSFDTTTVPNTGINQGSRVWQPSQTVEQRQTLDSAPTLLSGSWKPRSY